MGGFGSGRYGGGPTAESAFRIDIDALRGDGMIRFGVPFRGPEFFLDAGATNLD
jgi:hypothetical protein